MDADKSKLVDDLLGRLLNFKFASAKRYAEQLSELPADVVTGINALCVVYENTGWISGETGHIVGMSVTWLTLQIDLWRKGITVD